MSASCPSSGQTYINYPDFSNTTNLCFVDSAAPLQTLDGHVVRLTNTGAQDGEVWNFAQENVTNFYTTISFRITPVSGYPIGDGLTFAIQNSSSSAHGVGGGGIGYENINDSLVIEFDTFPNTGAPVYDPNNNHMAVQSCGTGPNSRNHQPPPNGCLVALFPNLVARDGSTLALADGNIHHVSISYTEATQLFVVNLDGFQATATFDLISNLNLTNGLAWVGFTSATFTAAENADLLNWTFASNGRAGIESAGLYDPSNGLFYIGDANPAAGIDYTFVYGIANDQPIFGDWTGVGVDTVGIFRSTTQNFYLRNSNTTGIGDIQFQFGNNGDVPLAGRWNAATTHDGVGLFRPSAGMVFLKNNLNGGSADYTLTLGIPGDQPVAGDWNGDGVDGIGVYRLTSPGNSPSAVTGTFYLQDAPCTGTCSAETFSMNVPNLGSNSHPAAGNWPYLGRSAVSIYDPSTGMFYQRNELNTGGVDTQFQLLSANATLVPINGNFGPLTSHCQVTSISGPIKFRFQPELWPQNKDRGYLFQLNTDNTITLNPTPQGGPWLWPPDRTALPPNGTTYLAPQVNGNAGVIPWDSSIPYQWYQVSVALGQRSPPVIGYIAYNPNSPSFATNCSSSLPLPQIYPPSVGQVNYAPATYAVQGVVSLFGTNMPPANVGSDGFHGPGVPPGPGSYFDVDPRNIEFCIDNFSTTAPTDCDPNFGASSATRIPVFAPAAGCSNSFPSQGTPYGAVIDLDCSLPAGTPTPVAHRYISITHLFLPKSGTVVPGQLIGYLCLSTELSSCNEIGELVHVAFNMYQQVPGNPNTTAIPQTLVPQEILGILAQPACTYNDFGFSQAAPTREYTPTLVACP